MATKWKNYEFPYRLIAVLLVILFAFSGCILTYTAAKNALLFDVKKDESVYESEYFYALIQQEVFQLHDFAKFNNKDYLKKIQEQYTLYDEYSNKISAEQRTMEIRLDQMLWLQKNLPEGTDPSAFTSYLFVNCKTPEDYAEAFLLCCPSLDTESFLQLARSDQSLPEIDSSQTLPEVTETYKDDSSDQTSSSSLLSDESVLAETETTFLFDTDSDSQWIFDAGDTTGEVQNPSGYAVELKGSDNPAIWLNYYYRIRIYLVERVGTPVLSENIYNYAETMLNQYDITNPYDAESLPENFTLPATDSIKYFFYYPATGEYITNIKAFQSDNGSGEMLSSEKAEDFFRQAVNEAKAAPWRLEVTENKTFDTAEAARRSHDSFRRDLFSSLVGDTVNLTEETLGGQVVLYSDLDNSEAGYADAYTFLQRQFNDAKKHQTLYLFFSAVSLLGFLATALYILIAGSGRKLGIDKLYNDWHFLFSGALLVVSGVGVVFLFFYRWSADLLSAYRPPLFLMTIQDLLIPALTAVFLLVLLEYLASVIRTGKNGTLISHSFWYVIGAKSKAAYRKYLKKQITDHPAFYKKQYKIVLFVGIVYSIITTLIAGLSYAPFLFIFVGAADIALLILILRHIKALDLITQETASIREGDYSHPLDTRKLPRHLQALAADLLYSREGMRNAIEKSVRDERLKAELITNVSHDLKTPLTSIVTYADLLQKRNLSDEKAREYVRVIDEKAHHLTHLIEDLTEASKASTGNIPLHKIQVNLYEMALQAIGENSDALQKDHIEILINDPVDSTIIYADNRQTYRIIDNLFSNVRKYAMPGTRVYVDVTKKDGNGIFTMKNISKNPLNIPAEELTRRFVRGDDSRSGEGSGLGLSIAKSLCELQNGSFSIEIDGDLFKVSFALPIAYQPSEKPETEPSPEPVNA